MVKISVIVPVYNVEQYLAECLDSIINQTLGDIEIICVDDCSTDGSLNILYEYEKKDSRIIVLKHDFNKGLGASRNTGMKYASGEYIGFIDSDDFVDKDMYLKLYNKASKFDLDLVFFKIAIFDNETGERDYNHPYFSLKKFDNFNKDIFTHNDTKNFTCDLCVSACSSFFKREYLVKNNFKFQEGMIFEDEPFFYNVYLNAKRVSLLKESFYFYRQNRKGSIMHTKDSTYMDVVKAFKFVRQAFIDSNNLTYEYKKYLYHRWFYVVLNRFSLVSDRKVKQEFFLRIKNYFKSIIQSKNDFILLSEGFQKRALNIFFSDSLDEFESYENNIKPQNHKIDEITNEYKISIILPIHNMEKHLHKSMDSIIHQSFGFENLEVLLVDDKSTDDTPNIIKYYSDKYENVTGVHLKENSGFAGKPRNIGMEYASSEYVMFLDPDDYYEENTCDILYNEITIENVDIVSGNYSDVEFNNSNKYNWKQKFGLNGHKFKVNNITENTKLLDINPSIWAKIYRKDFLLKNNIRFPEKLPGQDLYFNFVTLFKANGIIFIDESVVKYIARTNDNDLSVSCNDSKNVLKGLLEVYYKLYIFLENFNSNYSWFVLKQFRYYWIGRLINGNLNFIELKEIIDEASFLFREYLESNKIKPEIHKNLFHYIANKQYLAAYNEINIINKSNNKYLISLIIILKDAEFSLIPIMNAIKNQNIGFNNLEIILIDNTSRTNDKTIIQDFTNENENIRAFFFENENISYLYNQSIKKASADYLMFINPNIIIDKDYCNILLKNIIEENFDMVLGGNSEVLIDSDKNIDYDNLLLNNYLIWSKLFKKSFITSNNLNFDDCENCEALFINKCLFKTNRLKYINHPTFNIFTKHAKNNNQINIKNSRGINNYTSNSNNSMKQIRLQDQKRYLSMRSNNVFRKNKHNKKSAFGKFKSIFN